MSAPNRRRCLRSLLLVALPLACVAIARGEGRQPPRAPTIGTQQAGFSLRSRGMESLPVALEGYCPVTLHDRREWVEGREQFAAAFDGKWYYFADERQRAIFAAAPETYVPVLAGDCPVTFVETGQRVPGELRHGLMFNDRMYFLAGFEQVAEFQRAPQKYIDADLHGGGICPVTYAETGRRVAGNPDTALTFAGGLRFYFVNAGARREFLQSPGDFLTDDASGIPTWDLADSTLAPAPKSNRVGATAPDSSQSARPQPGVVAEAPRSTQADASEQRPAAANEKSGGVNAAEPLFSGHCPVSIWKDLENPWVPGRYEHRKSIDGMIFLPAGLAEREALIADPALYIPALGGDCVVTYVETGKRVRGSIWHSVQVPATHRIYLCADEAAAARLKADPDRYAGVDLAAGGKCVVTRRDTGEEVPGNPLIGAWFEGWRYLFVDEAAREKFLQDEQKYTAPIGDN